MLNRAYHVTTSSREAGSLGGGRLIQMERYEKAPLGKQHLVSSKRLVGVNARGTAVRDENTEVAGGG